MSKKPPSSSTSKTVQLGEPAKLTHSPFAGLGSDVAAEPATAGDAAAQPPAAENTEQGSTAARHGRLVLARETKHRRGKAVVVVRGFGELAGWDRAAIEQLARELKRALGCGGAVEGGRTIIVQGDRPAQVTEWLRAQGFRVEGVTS